MNASAPLLAPVERMDLFRQVLDRIVAYIEVNGLQVGDRLPGDRELAAALKVSRPLVRQSLKVLEGLGRVTAQQGSGTFVADNGLHVAASELLRGQEFGRALQEQLLPMRVAVDEQAIRAAYRNDRVALIGELRRVLGKRSLVLREEPDEASLDLGFEATFGRFCQNPLLKRLQAILHDAWLQVQIDISVPLSDRFALHEEHLAILDCLERQDLDGAMELFEAHVDHLRP